MMEHKMGKDTYFFVFYCGLQTPGEFIFIMIYYMPNKFI